MPYAACAPCERVFITSTEPDSTSSCPTCAAVLRTMTAEEARVYFLQVAVPGARVVLSPEDGKPPPLTGTDGK